jgi:hypothetical protein
VRKDALLFAALIVAFGLLVTAHLCIVAGLARRPPRWRSLAAFFLAPLAPYWALRDRMYVRGVVWIVAAVTYAAALTFAQAS